MSESVDRLAEALWRNGCRGYNVTTSWDDLSPDVRDYWRRRAESVDRADQPDDQVDIDTRVEVRDGKVTISFTVPREEIATLESVIVPDFLDQMADALFDKLKASGT